MQQALLWAWSSRSFCVVERAREQWDGFWPLLGEMAGLFYLLYCVGE
jgi:hypothetical protein